MTKRKQVLGLVGFVFLIALVIGVLYRSAASQDTASLNPSPTVLSVQTAVLEPATSENVARHFSGIIKAARTSDLGFKRAGRVEEVLFRSGQQVRQGDVLARLDSQQVRADLAQARASLAAAEAQLAEAISGPRWETIQAAQAQVADSQAEVNLWASRLARQKELIQSRAVSPQEYDDTRFQLESVTKRLERFQRQLDELNSGTRSEQIALARAGVNQWLATIERLEVEVAESELIAPYDGMIARRDADEGMVLPAGATVLRVVESAAIEAWIGLPADLTTGLLQRTGVSVTVGAQSYSATVREILPEVDLTTRTQTVVFELLPDENGYPVPGQMVRLTLTTRETTDGFWVPQSALSRGQRGLWAMLIVDPSDQTLQRRDVELLQVDSNRVRVRGLIAAGEAYVATGLHRVTVGQKVKTTRNAPQ